MTEFLLRRFVRDYERVGDPEVRERYGVLSGVVGILLNVALSLGKFLVGFATGAVSVTADALNNLTDAASSVVTLVGFRLAGQKADEEHPFGHGRMEYLTGLAVSVVILLVGLEVAKEAVGKIFHPQPVDFSALTAGVLAASVAVKLWMYFFNRGLSRKIKSSALQATAADSLSDAAGTAILLAGLLAGHFFELHLDGFLGIGVALFILRTGWESLRDTVDPLLGRAPDPELVRGIRETVLAHPEISGVHDLVVHDYGPGHVMVTLHAEVDIEGDMAATHDVIDNVERELAQRYRVIATIHMDPIATNDAHVNEVKETMLVLARKIDEGMTLHDFRMTEGPTHTNLIFDLVVPVGCPLSDEEVRREMARLAREENERYLTVIQVDHLYAQ